MAGKRVFRTELILEADRFRRGMRDSTRDADKFSEHTSKAGSALKAAFGAFSAGVVVTQMRNWVAAARDSNKTAAQTATVLKSTNNAAGLTADQFAQLAGQISKTAAVDDDLVQGGANIIATFTSIHGDVFRKTTKAAVDMAAAMNHGEVTQQGLQSSAILLGKAINDPIRGLSALTRVGVTFSDQQRQQITDMVKHGQVAKAQGVILAEVNKEFGGSAAAAVTPAKQLAVTWGNMQEVLGNLLIPAIDRGAQILNGILGVVDRNRTAFGVLFGVLGTGAAIIGALVVAEKVHKAVTEGVQAATKAWAGLQKGLNAVLAVTKVQAASAAVAEDALATSTAAAGTAAGGAATKFGAAGLLGGVSGLIGGLVRFSPLLITVAAGLDLWRKSSDKTVQSLHKVREATDESIDRAIKTGTVNQVLASQTRDTAKEQNNNALQTAFAAKQQEAQRLEMVKAVPQFQTSADKIALNADKAKELSGKLATLRQDFHSTVDSVKQAILGYDGLISKSKVTAGEVIRDLKNQTANFKTYSSDVRRLIKAGVDPKAIAELAQKGPQYIHALATGSNAQLRTYKQNWADRNREVRGEFADSMAKQYQGLVKKIKAMQAEINRLKGKTITIKARTDVEITKSVRQYLAASNVPGFHAKGAKIPGYGGGDVYPAMLEPGEAVVPKEKARRPEFKAWAGAQGIPGFQDGGLMGRYYNPTVAETRRIGISEGRVAAAAMRQLAASFGGFPGGAASGNVIRLALAQAKRMAASFKVALALIEAGIVESGLRNLPYGDRDSLGFLQQRPSQGWAHPMNVSYAAYDFLRRAIPIAGRYGSAGALAQAVQRSAFPSRYNQRQAQALGILNAYGYDSGGYLPPGLSVAYNGTGRPEPVGGSTTIVLQPQIGTVIGSDLRKASADLLQGIREDLRRRGKAATANLL